MINYRPSVKPALNSLLNEAILENPNKNIRIFDSDNNILMGHWVGKNVETICFRAIGDLYGKYGKYCSDK